MMIEPLTLKRGILALTLKTFLSMYLSHVCVCGQTRSPERDSGYVGSQPNLCCDTRGSPTCLVLSFLSSSPRLFTGLQLSVACFSVSHAAVSRSWEFEKKLEKDTASWSFSPGVEGCSPDLFPGVRRFRTYTWPSRAPLFLLSSGSSV